jgi:hypothetical protein
MEDAWHRITESVGGFVKSGELFAVVSNIPRAAYECLLAYKRSNDVRNGLDREVASRLVN